MNYNVTSDIPYIPNGHPLQKLDLYIPKPSPATTTTSSTASPSQPHLHPLIIYIHGGAFLFGSKTSHLLPLHLMRSGSFALASLDYRLAGDAPFPAAIQDCKAAVRFLRAHAAEYSLDPARFVSMGESAGGYLATMVGLTGTGYLPAPTTDFLRPDYLNDVSDAVSATVDLYGPTDFAQMDDQLPPDVRSHNAADSPESRFLGVQITEAPELVRQANPITYVGEQSPPFFIAHGVVDKVVPVGQSIILDAALKEKERDVVLWLVEGADHCFDGIGEEQQKDLDQAIDAFLRKVLEA